MIRHALILTAGLGTRLRPLTDVRAKPAMPVGGEPMIRRIIAWLASRGVSDLVLNLHHRPETLTAVVGDGSDLGATVRYSWEQPRVLGSAGGPRQALPILGTETFFVINGDTITDVDLPQIAKAHLSSGALVTLALVPNRDFERYGGVQVDAHDRVTGFLNRGPSAQGSWHFVGVQVASASVFASLPSGTHANSIGGVYDDLIRTCPGSVRAFRCDAEFWDVGTPADYWRTSQAFIERSRLSERVEQSEQSEQGEQGEPVSVGRNVAIDASASVRRSILWDEVEVAAGAVLDHCIVTDHVRIPKGAEYRNAIVVRQGDDVDALSIFPLSR